MTFYPSDGFLQNAERYMIYRYAIFVLQSVPWLTRVYQAPKIMLKTYGEGFMSSARCALLMLGTTHQQEDAATRLLSLKRHLYARMLIESETNEDVEAVISNEWKEDRCAGMKDRLDFFDERSIWADLRWNLSSHKIKIELGKAIGQCMAGVITRQKL